MVFPSVSPGGYTEVRIRIRSFVNRFQIQFEIPISPPLSGETSIFTNHFLFQVVQTKSVVVNFVPERLLTIITKYGFEEEQ